MPKVKNARLAKYLKQLYQATDKTPGGTARALREEAATGNPTKGSFHDVKAEGIKNGLTKLLRSGSLEEPEDIATARATLQDVSSSLDAWDRAADSGAFSEAAGRGEISTDRINAGIQRFGTTDLSPFDNPANPGAYIGPETSFGAPDSAVGGEGGGVVVGDESGVIPDPF